MPDSSTLLAIYDAPMVREKWRTSLDHCARLTDAKAVMLYEFPGTIDMRYRLDAASSDVDRILDVLRDYNDLLHSGRGSDFERQGLATVHASDLFTLHFDHDIWQMDSGFYERPEVALSLRAGYHRRALLNLSNDPSMLGGLIFLYGSEYKSGIPAGVGAATAIAPHVKKAMELHRMAEALRQQYNAVLAVLDRIDAGILLLTERGDVVLANRAARQIAEASDGFSLGRGDALTLRDAEAKDALRAAVARAARTANGDGTDAGAAVEIPRLRGDTPLLAMVSPVRDSNMEIDRNLSGALITLIDPDRETRVEFLWRAFQLSPPIN